MVWRSSKAAPAAAFFAYSLVCDDSPYDKRMHSLLQNTRAIVLQFESQARS